MFSSNPTLDAMTLISSPKDAHTCPPGETKGPLLGHSSAAILSYLYTPPSWARGTRTIARAGHWGSQHPPTQADNRAMHELAFSTNLMVSSQSLSSVLRKEKLNLAKSFSFFSLPLISCKSPGEPNIAKSCHETAG